jgi:hypothetical protein
MKFDPINPAPPVTSSFISVLVAKNYTIQNKYLGEARLLAARTANNE